MGCYGHALGTKHGKGMQESGWSMDEEGKIIYKWRCSCGHENTHEVEAGKTEGEFHCGNDLCEQISRAYGFPARITAKDVRTEGHNHRTFTWNCLGEHCGRENSGSAERNEREKICVCTGCNRKVQIVEI